MKMVVGAPNGLAYSMSVGWVSARWPPNIIFPDMLLAEFLQTTATINTGNSGGPLFNMVGEVIGIVSQNISKSVGSEGLGFVVTSNSARNLLVPRKVFWSALQGILLTGRIVTIGGREIPVRGDIILSVEGIPVVSEDNIEKIRNTLVGMAPGAPFKMSVLRAGKVIELTGTAR